MNAPTSFGPPLSGAQPVLPGAGRPEFGQASASAMSMKWSALHDAANVVAMLAGIAAEPMGVQIRNFPAVMRDAGGWRRDLAEQVGVVAEGAEEVHRLHQRLARRHLHHRRVVRRGRRHDHVCHQRLAVLRLPTSP